MSFQDQTPPTFVEAVPGSYPKTARTFASLTEFAAAMPPRIASRERDFGLAWRDGAAVYRAAWIEDTGELYVVQLGDPEHGGGHVEVLAARASLERTRRALLGWRAWCGREDSLAWLRSACRELDADDAVVPAPG
jgi:hypothetical protein